MDLTLITTLGVLLGCILGLSWFAGSDAPYIPTKMEAIKKILKLAGIKKGKKFYELGSGDGRIVIAAAALDTDAVGIEQSWIRVLYSRWIASRQNSSVAKNCKFYHGDIFTEHYSDADIIYIYLLLNGVKKLEKKLEKELKKGSIVITQTYHFQNWKPFKTIDMRKEIDFSKDINGAGIFQFYKK